MDYSNARERDLLDEIELAQIAIKRQEGRIADAKKALANLRSGSNGGEYKWEGENLHQ